MTSQDYDNFMAALCIFREARGSSITAMNAIWHVLNNRANDKQNRWPKFIADVITQPNQFSSFNHDDPNALKFPNRLHPADWNAFLNVMTVVGNELGADPTGGATNYYSGDNPPYWAKSMTLTLELGPFKFYK